MSFVKMSVKRISRFYLPFTNFFHSIDKKTRLYVFFCYFNIYCIYGLKCIICVFGGNQSFCTAHFVWSATHRRSCYRALIDAYGGVVGVRVVHRMLKSMAPAGVMTCK